VLWLSVSLAPAAAGAPPADSLTPGRTLRRTIAAGQVQSFRVTVTEGQWFQIQARALRLTINLALKAPDGQTLFESYPVYVGDNEAAPVWIAQVSGPHVLEASVSGRSKGRGGYELRLSEPRSAQPEDHKRLLAQSVRMDSRRLTVAPDRDRLAQARQKCDEGMAIARELADPRLESRFHRCLSSVLQLSGDLRGTFEAAQQAFVLDRPGYPRAEANDRVQMAEFYLRSGDYQQALEHLEAARALFHSLGDQWSEASQLGNLGALYTSLNEDAKALQLENQALPILLSLGDNVSVAHNLTGAAYSHMELGQLILARQGFQRALALFQAEKRPGDEGKTWGRIGVVHYRLGQYEKALGFLDRGLALLRANRNLGEAWVLHSLGDVYRKLGQYDQALDHYRQSLPIAGQAGRTRDQIGTLVSVAALERDRGNLAEARRQIDSVTRWFEDTRQGLLSEDLRQSFSGVLREAYEVQVDVLMRLHARNPGEGHDRAALELSERGRSQTLMEMLREARVVLRPELEPGLLQRANALRDELNAKAMLQMTGTGASPGADASALAQQIADLTRQQDQIRTEIRRAAPRYSALSQPTALGLAEIQALLDDQTVLLEYQVGTEGSYAWAITSGAVTSTTLGQGKEIDALARRLHRHWTARNRLPPGATAPELRRQMDRAERESRLAARQLSERILGPLPAPSGKRLAIVADGALQYVPLAALPAPASWGGKNGPLIDRYEVVNLPSASVLALLRREQQGRPRAPKEIAVFADPVFDRRDIRVRGRAAGGSGSRSRLDRGAGARTVFSPSAGNLNLFRPGLTMSGTSLPRLEYTRQLAETALRGVPADDGFKALDFAANRQAVLASSLAQYRTVVFATHGLANAQYPELSGIALSMVDAQGRPQEGFLRLHDVYNLELNADLVVLGACETGVGKEIRGEGLIGLSRGFLYAGASRVLASLWKVDEEATVALLQEFHRSVRRGQPYPAALRDAQLQVRREPRWRSPYYWAGFVLQGEWVGAETRNQ
jgi:CHAT domain-containing protein/Tfp pilus assembly protein PilF